MAFASITMWSFSMITRHIGSMYKSLSKFGWGRLEVFACLGMSILVFGLYNGEYSSLGASNHTHTVH